MLPTTPTQPKTSYQDLRVLLYGATKIGKSTFASHLPGALFLATEAGLNHVEVCQMPIRSWEALLDACKDIAAGKHNYRTIVIDTIDNAALLCREHVCAQQGVLHESELEYGKGYALVAAEFWRVATKLSLLPYGLWMISHAVEKEVEIGGRKATKIVPSLPDKARATILGMADQVLFAELDGARRVLRTKPNQRYEAGDRTGLLPDTIGLSYDDMVACYTRSELTTK